MQLQEVLAVLSDHQEELRELGVKSLAVFGSVVRDEAGPTSDVDLLAEFNRPFGFFKFVEVKDYLESILGCAVDLATPDGLHPALRDRILGEALRAA